MCKLRRKVDILLAQFIVILLIPINVYGEEIYIDDDILLSTSLESDDILYEGNTEIDDILYIDDEENEESETFSGTASREEQTVWERNTQVIPTKKESSLKSLPKPTSNKSPALIVVHRISNTCMVYDSNGEVVNSFVVSTGRKGHGTPVGTFQIYEHSTAGGYHYMVDGTYGRWCMRFRQGGYMFHSVCYARYGDSLPIPQEVADLGTSVSRGCVRLSVADAEWLYKNTPNGCKVLVVND